VNNMVKQGTPGWRTALLVLPMVLAAACGNKDDDPVDTGADVVTLPNIYINEFMASNSSTYADESGAFPDWIELYNASNEDADLTGWWITDDNTEPMKHEILEGVVVPAGGFFVLFADGDIDQGVNHLSFSLDADGEDIGLYGPSEFDTPEIDALDAYPVQITDISLARTPDGSPQFEATENPTPGASNGGR